MTFTTYCKSLATSSCSKLLSFTNEYSKTYFAVNAQVTTMHLLNVLVSLISCLSISVSATALTYNLAANENTCFFAEVKEKEAKVAFYFAVWAGILIRSF